jgi:glycosyltransferase involved in cell wall biosynthesis
MKALFKRLIGADRPSVIAVIGLTLEQVSAGVAHARTSGSGLPVWAWSAEAAGYSAEPCDRFVSGASASRVRKDLSTVWPALTIVCWNGERRGAALKLVPFIVPPFRIVVANEAGGFFAAQPRSVADHARRRLRDASLSAARRICDWVGGLTAWLWSLLLALLGVLAKATHPLTRAAMRNRRMGRPSAAIVPESCGIRFTEIVISGRAWPRRRVLNAALNRSVDFIVLRRLGETADPESLIALARETNAFAVGRQIAWAGWRKTIVSKHPFRKLQPEEVTQVFAPWSSLIVIRRDLLLRLGVPHAITHGAALLVLYWRAAAASLKCLIAGQPEAITQEPAMELEDAEFALRLALSNELNKLGPAHMPRLRGNVVSSPQHRNTFRAGFPRVLVVSPYLPFPLSHGGAVRIYNLCRAMSGEVDFVLACFREAQETVRYTELHHVFREVHAIDIDEKYSDSSLPGQVVEYRNTAMAELIRSQCLSGRIDVVQLEYTQTAEYAEHTGAVPVVLVEHDLTFNLHGQFASTLGTPAARRQYELWHAFERSALQCANAVWVMSSRDKAIAVRHGASRRGTFVVPNGVDLQRFRPVRRQTHERIILFIGSFRHLPNLLAFEALRDIIMPLVWQVDPEVELNVIAGAQHRHRTPLDPRIRVQGFVDDVRPAYRECDVAVIPLPLSAGTNIKLMEAMACGRAVVSTAVGCQGLDLLDGSDLLIREIGPEFAAAILELMKNEPRRTRIASRARKTAEVRFGWDAIAVDALQSYLNLQGAGEQTPVQQLH